MRTEIQIKIRGYHIDHFGHVNNGRYFTFFEEGHWNYFDDKPELIDYFHEKYLAHVVSKIIIQYKKPFFISDTITIETDVLESKGSGFTMFQTLYKKDKDVIAATAKVNNVFVNAMNGNTAPMPEELVGLWPDLGI